MQYLKYRKYILYSEIVFLILFFARVSFAQGSLLFKNEIVIKPFFNENKIDVSFSIEDKKHVLCTIESLPQITYVYKSKSSGPFHIYLKKMQFGYAPFIYHVFYTHPCSGYYNNLGKKKWEAFIRQKEKRGLYKRQKISIRNNKLHFTFYLPRYFLPKKLNLTCFNGEQEIFSHTISVRYCSFLSVIDNLREKNGFIYGVALIFVVILIGLLYNLILNIFKT
ncbi:MAG: hypothetical protein U9N18_04670 [Campylobacterota bacterium]|nr:hypothetical protein [Campylobacterota bacterium]